ncbi:MAG: STAS domain-containing protein [Armatimonadetes bacterium]|nr:STAS domain-containing protein [Armatimonadota bacterium]
MQLLEIQGELNFNSSREHLRRLREMADEASGVSLDLSGVSVVDVSGMALILSASEFLRKRGKPLVLRRVSAPIRKAFSLLNLRLTPSGTIEAEAAGCRRAGRSGTRGAAG